MNELEKDLKNLYGENYKEINEKRHELWLETENIKHLTRNLQSFIQNPVPITEENFKLFEKSRKQINQVIDELEQFIKDYHLR